MPLMIALLDYTPSTPSSGPAWLEDGCETPYALFSPASATDKTDSLQDLSGNGRNLTENGSVVFTSGTGWSGFTPSNNFTLSGPFTVDGTFSVVIRYSNLNQGVAGTRRLFGAFDLGNSTALSLQIDTTPNSITLWHGSFGATFNSATLAPTAGVIAMAGPELFLDKTSLGSIGSPNYIAMNPGQNMTIGYDGVAATAGVTIHAIGLWDCLLSAAQVSAITDSMNLL